MKTIPDPQNKSQSYILHKHIFDYIKVVETDPNKSPPNVARAYFLLGSLCWNAYAVIDSNFPFVDGFNCDKVNMEGTTSEKKWKLFYVLFYVLWNEIQSFLYPSLTRMDNPLPTIRMQITRKFQIATRIYLKNRRLDGFDNPNSFNYTNKGNYIEANSGNIQDLSTLPNPNEWTPLQTEISGQTKQQTPLLPFYGQVKNLFTNQDWSIINSLASDFYPSTMIRDEQIQELVTICSSLTPEEKMKAEVWAGFEPDRATPPGKAMILLALVLAAKDYDTKEAVALIGGISICLFHAGVAAWKIKYDYMQARPIQWIRKNYLNQMIVSPGDGITKNGAFWLPYQPVSGYTPPFPDYISGHSTFTMAFSTFMNLATGSDSIPIQGCTIDPVYFKLFSAVFDQMSHPTLFSNLALKPLSSLIVEETPVIPIELRWTSWSQIAREAGMSRIYGGIHWENSNSGGLAVGQAIASLIIQKLNWNRLNLKF